MGNRKEIVYEHPMENVSKIRIESWMEIIRKSFRKSNGNHIEIRMEKHMKKNVRKSHGTSTSEIELNSH